jgi:hypothetical protein
MRTQPISDDTATWPRVTRGSVDDAATIRISADVKNAYVIKGIALPPPTESVQYTLEHGVMRAVVLPYVPDLPLLFAPNHRCIQLLVFRAEALSKHSIVNRPVRAAR